MRDRRKHEAPGSCEELTTCTPATRPCNSPSIELAGMSVEFLGLDRGHGTRQVALLDLSVTHDHHFVHGRGLLDQHDVERGAAADLHRLRFIADEIDGKGGRPKPPGQ